MKCINTSHKSKCWILKPLEKLANKVHDWCTVHRIVHQVLNIRIIEVRLLSTHSTLLTFVVSFALLCFAFATSITVYISTAMIHPMHKDIKKKSKMKLCSKSSGIRNRISRRNKTMVKHWSWNKSFCECEQVKKKNENRKKTTGNSWTGSEKENDWK